MKTVQQAREDDREGEIEDPYNHRKIAEERENYR